MSRAERVATLIKEEVSDILRTEVSDPRIGFTSVTDVEISPDLKFVKIFVSVYGDEEKKKETMQGLKSATKFIRGELAERINLRLVPEIIFKRDDSIERGSRVLALMARLKQEKVKAKPARAGKKRK